MKKYFLLSITILLYTFVPAQQKRHIVEAKETLYGLSKKYQIPIEELRKSNPQLNERTPQIGEVLIIPDKASANTTTIHNTTAATPVNKPSVSTAKNTYATEEYVYVTIEPKETLYGLSKKYDTDIDTIKKLNPNMDEKGPKIGEVLKLPVTKNTKPHLAQDNPKPTPPVEQPKTENVEKENNINITETIEINKEAIDKEAINIVMFLPFHSDITEGSAERNIAEEFYSGAYIALDSLTNKGKKITVNVLDSGEDNKFRERLNTYDFSNTQLIIGPLFKSGILATVDKVKRIPVISPFTCSDELDNYPNLILYDTKEEVLAEKLVEELMKKYSGEKIYILYDTNHSDTAYYLQSLIQNKNNNAQIVLTNNAGDIEPQQNLVTQKYNKIYSVIISDQNNFVTDYLNTITSWDSSLIQPISLFYSPLFDNKKYSNKLLDLGLIYSDTKYVNEYGFNEQKTINTYKKKYCTIPSKYAISGFDIVYDIINRMDDKGALSDKSMETERKQLSNKYFFARVKKNGAWANQGARIIQLLK